MTRIKGLNWTKVKGKDGKPTRWYLYAYRNGPRIGYHEGPRRPRIGPKELAAYQAAMAGRTVVGSNKVAELCRDWLASPEWKTLAPGTRRNWLRFVDMIEKRWGDNKIQLLNDPRLLPRIIAWRNEVADKPKTADERVKVMRSLLEWGRLNGRLTVNVATGIPTLYRGGDRAEIVWTDEDMAAFTAQAIALERPQIVDGMRLAALTGLRRADLVTATFDHIGDKSLSLTAAKASRKKQRRVFVPLIPELRDLLDELRTRPRAEDVNTLLVNSFGRPWSGDGFGGSFNRVRDAAAIVHVTEEGERKLKHLHDLRGTYATKLILRGETDAEVAAIMGWAPERVGNIRKVYVDQQRVVVGIAERMGK
jgi:integrase